MRFTIPVTWTMCGDMEIEASCLEEAINKADNAELPEGTFVSDSFKIDTENINCALD